MRGLKSIGLATEFWKITKELNPQTIEQEATNGFRVVITGNSGVDLDWLLSALIRGRPGSASVVTYSLAAGDPSVEGLPFGDIYLYVARPGARLSRNEADAIHRLDARGNPVVLLLTRPDSAVSDEETKLGADHVLGTIPFHRIVVVRPGSDEDIDERILPTLLEAVPHLQLSLARQLPRFRALVALQIVRETSRVNAEFALLSSIPASIPIVGAVVATGADMMVLTKNQIMMLFKLASIHERDLMDRVALVAEMLPVVGGAFLWRSLARTIVQLLPGFVAAVPKALVAAVGTYVVGNIALYYYQMGQKPDSNVVVQFKRDGLERARSFLPEIQRRIVERPRKDLGQPPESPEVLPERQLI